MAKIDKATIEVTANLTIPDATAERCLKILEMWLEDNEDADIVCDRIGGKCKMRIQRRVRSCFECPDYVDIDNEPARCGLNIDPLKCAKRGRHGKE